jgi:hypothetical protein
MLSLTDIRVLRSMPTSLVCTALVIWTCPAPKRIATFNLSHVTEGYAPTASEGSEFSEPETVLNLEDTLSHIFGTRWALGKCALRLEMFEYIT